MRRLQVAIVGGGIAGVTAAWQLQRLGMRDVTLFEASGRLGGIVETVRRDGFVVECGPDGWVTEKPWARELAEELGLAGELIGSLDEGRVTWLIQDGKLVAMPDGMRMMVPADLDALEGSPLFSDNARQAFRDECWRAEELRASAPAADESVAAFVRRHFGEEVLAKVGAPLLSGVFGGDVARLSVRAVMPQFVRMEREHGSLVLALQAALARDAGKAKPPIFTTLRSGTGTLVERIVAEVPPGWVRLRTPVTGISRDASGRWWVEAEGQLQSYDALLLATPAHVARALLRPVSSRMAELLTMEASSAVIVALAFREGFALPRGFGFLVPAGEGNQLLAATFVDQKYPDRVPAGGRLLRAFFGGARGQEVARLPDEQVAALGRRELEAIVGKLPEPAFSVVRRWPRSLPQYGVGHLERMLELETLRMQLPGLHLLGNAYKGVGLPDLVRDARAAAQAIYQLSAD